MACIYSDIKYKVRINLRINEAIFSIIPSLVMSVFNHFSSVLNYLFITFQNSSLHIQHCKTWVIIQHFQLFWLPIPEFLLIMYPWSCIHSWSSLSFVFFGETTIFAAAYKSRIKFYSNQKNLSFVFTNLQRVLSHVQNHFMWTFRLDIKPSWREIAHFVKWRKIKKKRKEKKV